MASPSTSPCSAVVSTSISRFGHDLLTDFAWHSGPFVAAAATTWVARSGLLPDGTDVFLNHDARLEAPTTHQIKVLHDGPSGTTSISISEPSVAEGVNATGEPQPGHRRTVNKARCKTTPYSYQPIPRSRYPGSLARSTHWANGSAASGRRMSPGKNVTRNG